jgi:CheY-like chemotaxis protein
VTCRCLIVDDNRQFGDTARSLLEGHGMAVVGIATSGVEAVQRAEELRPDVALIDIDLGDESGFEVARRLADHGRSSRPRLILISTHDPCEFADLIEASPAVGFLPKTDLSASAICELLARAGGADAAN